MSCCGKGSGPTEPQSPQLPKSIDAALLQAQLQGVRVADKALAQRRFDSCKTCPHFKMDVNLCKRCGCQVLAKVGRALEACPALRW